MFEVELGRTGTRIPEIGMGMWAYHGGPEPLVAGLDAGARFIDTAESYGNEEVAARAMKGRRGSVFLATKVSASNLRRADVFRAADGSLQRLGTDYIDLYQVHNPNPAVPVEETLGAMEELVDAGKIRFVGVSNFSLVQLRSAQRAMRRRRIVSNQVRYSIIDRTIERELLPYCQADGITIIAYSPLGREFQRIVDCDRRGVLSKVGAETGRTPAQVALNWCLCKQGVAAIPKSNSATHILQNCGASDWRLSEDQIAALNQSIFFRTRSPLEALLRRCIPGSFIGSLKRVVRHLPAGLRRRIN